MLRLVHPPWADLRKGEEQKTIVNVAGVQPQFQPPHPAEKILSCLVLQHPFHDRLQWWQRKR